MLSEQVKAIHLPRTMKLYAMIGAIKQHQIPKLMYRHMTPVQQHQLQLHAPLLNQQDQQILIIPHPSHIHTLPLVHILILVRIQSLIPILILIPIQILDRILIHIQPLVHIPLLTHTLLLAHILSLILMSILTLILYQTFQDIHLIPSYLLTFQA